MAEHRIDEPALGVGAAAAGSGVSVRTLQFYDRIGLLAVGRDRSGRRRYGRADLARLQQIRMLTAAGMPLADVRRVLDDDTAPPAHERYAAQAAWCERRELGLRAQRTVLESLVWVLRRHPDVTVPSAVLTALMDVEQTLLRYAGVYAAGTAPAALEARDAAWHIECYFRWKAVSVEALLLMSTPLPPCSPSGVLVGEHWDAYLTFAVGDRADPELSEAYRAAAAYRDRWPQADRDLYESTREFLESCHHAYLSRRGPRC
ncbi:MAG TPA: MerR family transcriptional regulator [Pilimelia sp.]|nr:MerR family transcriptional regulator [Pilimelia sp.]